MEDANNRYSGTVFLAMMIIVASATGGGGGWEDAGARIVYGADNCLYVEGTIVDKTEEPYEIWVISNEGNFRIITDEDSWNAAEINKTYSGQICSTEDSFLWELWQQIIAGADVLDLQDFNVGELYGSS